MSELPYDLTVTEIDGESALVVQAAIADHWPDELKDGMAARRTANVTGSCPSCGARARMPNRAQRRAARKARQVLHVVMQHDDECPALLGRK